MTATRAQVNDVLRGTYTEDGVGRWWNRPRRSLNLYTPNEYWEIDPDRVLELAERGY